MSNEQKKLITAQSITEWMQKNLIALVVGFFILIAVFICGVLFLEWEEKQERSIHGQLYQLKSQFYQAATKVNGKDYGEDAPNPYDLLSKNKKEKSLVFSSEMNSLSQSYESEIRKHASKIVGAIFAIDLASIYYKHDKKDQAKKLLSFFAHPNKISAAYHLASFQLANYYMNDKDCKKAQEIWTQVIANKRAKYLHQDALKQSAFCYEQEKNYTAAKEAYEKLIQDYPNNFETQQIKKYLQMLTLKQNLESS